MTIDFSMTVGDLVVAAASTCSILGAYFALKSQLERLHSRADGFDKAFQDVTEIVDEHADYIGVHSEQLASLETHVFGRRSYDKIKRRKARFTMHPPVPIED